MIRGYNDQQIGGIMDNNNNAMKKMTVTIFDGNVQPRAIQLDSFNKTTVTFGRSEWNDIVLQSTLVSRDHGRFNYVDGQWLIEDRGFYTSRNSENGLIYNNTYIISKSISDGDFIKIDGGMESFSESVLFVFSTHDSQNRWETISLKDRNEITIGSGRNCDIVLPHISVSKLHARIIYQRGHFYIYDNNSANGVIVNDQPVANVQELHEKDVIVITNSKLIFTSSSISYCWYRNGVSVDAENIVITRGKGRRSFITCDHASVNIKPGELVAIIGGSGAGKSTILNCMCGYLAPAQGEVYINGVDLYKNFDSLKKLIGYVPQSDIVYDDLTLYDMLRYTARLRLPKDTSEEEQEFMINRAIQLVELPEKRNSFIKSLSGGQKKRASIAVELLSDPNLLFLDEPASGLDPGTERNLMKSLREMANNGKTVILVTHSTLQLQLCDKIMFMGKGGNLCFCGSYYDALKFFGVSDVVDIYNMITDEPEKWRGKFDNTNLNDRRFRRITEKMNPIITREKNQLPVLCSRYLKLVVNDRQRLMLLLFQAPILALLISLVTDGKQFEIYEATKSLLFSLSCSAFWVGMLNAIQEVCKERTILKREYMTGLSLNAYIISKIIILGALSFIQSLMIITVFSITVGLPEEGLFMHPFIEFFITTFLTAVASAAMGLSVSSLFTNTDRAMTVAPIMLMPQILFSGLIFKLDGATELISWLAVCRWSMEGYGTTANLNDLQLKLQSEGMMLPHEAESFFEFDTTHLLKAWFILIIFVFLFLLIARIVLRSISNEKS